MTTREKITAVRAEYPKYSKTAHSLAERSEITGIQRTARANALIANKRPAIEHRANPCRYTFRLPEDLASEFNSAQTYYGYDTAQAFLFDLVHAVVKIRKEEAAVQREASSESKI